MARLRPLTPDSAVGAARERLTELTTRHGQVGDMVAMMAHSPAVLSGYLELSRAIKRAKLARSISERISVAVQQHLGCATCLAAHIDAARSLGIDDAEIELARRGTSGDPAVAAMVAFGRQLLIAPAQVSDEQFGQLRAHGYSDREITDAVGIVALNLLTGSFNLVAGLEPATATPDARATA